MSRAFTLLVAIFLGVLCRRSRLNSLINLSLISKYCQNIVQFNRFIPYFSSSYFSQGRGSVHVHACIR